MTTFENVGETDYDALMVQVEKRFSQNYSARVSYTLAYSRGNTSGAGAPASPFQVLDDLNLDLNEGPTNFDQRHNFVVSGTAMVPKTGGLTVSWVARALSGSPFTIFDSTIDTDRNGTLADPLPAGTYSGTGANAISVESEGGRNGAYGPGYLQAGPATRLPARSGGTAAPSTCSARSSTSPTARTSPIPPVTRSSANFLRLTGLSTSTQPRTGQFGVRFGF